jgi:hypothetical protein
MFAGVLTVLFSDRTYKTPISTSGEPTFSNLNPFDPTKPDSILVHVYNDPQQPAGSQARIDMWLQSWGNAFFSIQPDCTLGATGVLVGRGNAVGGGASSALYTLALGQGTEQDAD